MNSAFTNVFSLSTTTFVLELPTNASRKLTLDIPVSWKSQRGTHLLEIKWNSTCSHWSNTDLGDRYSYEFSLVGSLGSVFKYVKSSYKIIVKNNLFWPGKTLLENTNDLIEPYYNEFKFHKDSVFIDSNLSTVIVEITLESYPGALARPSSEETPNVLSKMLNLGILTDFAIKSKFGDIKCHKNVLAGQSKYFREMFEKDQSKNVVDWTDEFDAAIVQDMVQFLYTGLVPHRLNGNYFKLMDIADKYFIEGLKNACETQFKYNINHLNAIDLLNEAVQKGREEFQVLIVNFMVKNCDSRSKFAFNTMGFRKQSGARSVLKPSSQKREPKADVCELKPPVQPFSFGGLTSPFGTTLLNADESKHSQPDSTKNSSLFGAVSDDSKPNVFRKTFSFGAQPKDSDPDAIQTTFSFDAQPKDSDPDAIQTTFSFGAQPNFATTLSNVAESKNSQSDSIKNSSLFGYPKLVAVPSNFSGFSFDAQPKDSESEKYPWERLDPEISKKLTNTILKTLIMKNITL